MSHHSSEFPAPDWLEEKNRKQLGSTDQFSQGELTLQHGGELNLAITHKNGKVIMDFGKPVVWIRCNAKQAKNIAKLLLKHAEEII